MIASFEECRKLLSRHRSQHGPALKRWEMSTKTYRQMMSKIPQLTPTNYQVTALWGVSIVINESVPEGEVRPIYA